MKPASARFAEVPKRESIMARSKGSKSMSYNKGGKSGNELIHQRSGGEGKKVSAVSNKVQTGIEHKGDGMKKTSKY